MFICGILCNPCPIFVGGILSKKAVEIPQDKLDLYDKLIAQNPDIERKGVTRRATCTVDKWGEKPG